jgi:hypothetical protein
MPNLTLDQRVQVLLSGVAGMVVVVCAVALWPWGGGAPDGTSARAALGTDDRAATKRPVQTASWALVGRDNPDGDIDIECSACHTAEGWVPLRDSLAFRYNADTEFRRTGVGPVVPCGKGRMGERERGGWRALPSSPNGACGVGITRWSTASGK